MLSTLLSAPSPSPSPPSSPSSSASRSPSPSAPTSPQPHAARHNGKNNNPRPRTRPRTPPSPGTILTSATGALTLFNPSYVPTSHGIPGGLITYRPRPRHHYRQHQLDPPPTAADGSTLPDDDDGQQDEEWRITVRLPDPGTGGDDGTGLMAQYVWNAGVVGAEMVLGVDSLIEQDASPSPSSAICTGTGPDQSTMSSRPWRRQWDLRGHRVLELGAGTALPSLTALRLLPLLPTSSIPPPQSTSPSFIQQTSPTQITITDYPSPTLISTIRANVAANPPLSHPHPHSHSLSSPSHPPALAPEVKVKVLGHKWGDFPSSPSSSPDPKPSSPSTPLPSSNAQDDDSAQNDQLDFIRQEKGTYTRIILTDTLWLGREHVNLARSLAWFLRPSPSSPSAPSLSPPTSSLPTAPASDKKSLVYLTAGYHTGLPTLTSFFTTARTVAGLHVLDIWEIDNGFNVRECAWYSRQSSSNGDDGAEDGEKEMRKMYDRAGGERERWTVCAVLGFEEE